MFPAPPTANPLVLFPCFKDAPQGYDYDEPEQRWPVQEDDDDLMHGDGEEWEDPDYPIAPVPLTGVAGVLHPSDSSRAFVFCAGGYVTIKVIPGTMGDTTARGSKVIVHDWPSLGKTSFAGWIDAVLPIPNSNYMYFFSSENYALIHAEPVGVSQKRGFKTIDAVLPNPLNSEQAYFFRGGQYVLVHVRQGPNKDYIVDGPKPIWRCLKDAGFEEIAMILPNPLNSNEAYVFSGDEYALISIRHDPSDNCIIDGPKAISTKWPSLRQASFF